MTLTASVSPSNATGAVTFTDNGNSIGTANLNSGGGASITTSSLAAGSHTLAATYGGDNTFNGSTSGAVAVAVGPGTSATSLSVSQNPANSGQNVTLNAIVTPNTATGTVTFQDNGAAIGTVTLTNGSAAFNTSSLTVGSHPLTAAYSGNTQLNPSTSAPILEVINSATSSTTTALIVSPNPASPGTPVTLTATVTPTTATGTVTFRDGNQIIGQANLSGGSGSISTSTLTAGSHSLTASYGGDTNNGASTSAPVVEVISPVNGTVTLTSSANPITAGQLVTFTVTITPTTATGSVTIFDSFTSSFLICVTNTDCTLNNGVATLTTSALGAGTHPLQAFYGGDANNAASQSNILREVVNPATAPTTTTLTVSPITSTSGQTVTLTAAVAPVSSVTSGALPNGTITFLDGTTTLGTGTLVNGTATFTTSTLASGTHSLTASYSGDSNFAPSTSTAVTVTVSAGAASTTTSLVVSPNTSNVGQAVTLTATVTPNTATGTVTFKDGTTTVGTATLSGGTGSITITTLTAGTHSLTAAYGGDSKNAASTSSAVTVTVSQPSATTKTTLTVSPNPSSFGQTVTLTATLTPTSATGSVTFLDGQTRLGAANLSGGTAVFTTATLASGNHNLTASYGGDSSNGASTSAAVTLAVSAPAPVNISAPACCALPPAFVGVPYSQTFRATGGVAPLTWILASNTTPDLTMGGATGVLSGTPKTAGNFQVTIRVQDSAQQANAAIYTLSVVQAATVNWPPLTPPSPQDQPTSQLTLAQAYPFAVTGTVTLTFAPNATNNSLALYQAVQFVTGGTTFQVTIPAGSTTPSPALPAIQLGSVAGTITGTLGALTMTGGTQTVPFAGQAPTTTILVPRVPPIITANSVKITAITASNFQVVLDAQSTPRDLSSAVLTFAAASGDTLNGCSPNCSVQLATGATAWFASGPGQTNGGTFSLTLTFPYTGDTTALNTVSVALVNSAGTSATVAGSR